MSESQEWINRFVANGGSEEDARATLAMMAAAKAAQPTTPPAAPSSPAGTSTDVTSTSAGASTDLFGDAPGGAAPQRPRALKVARPARKVGRPETDWSTKPKSQRERDLFELSLEIEDKNARESGYLGFIATAMIYASLPHSEIDGAVFKRQNNDIRLTILNDPEIGLPFGKLPRVITAFLCTEAKRQEQEDRPEVIKLGRSQSAFAAKLGLSTSGGRNGDVTRLKDQCKRLFTSHITLTGQPGSQFHWRNVAITDSGMLLWDPHNPEEKARWNSELTLSRPFFEECIAHGVPIDMRVLHKLRSPLAIDLYIWLTYRYNSIRYPTPMSWKQLKFALGSNYGDDPQGLRDFIKNVKIQLRSVTALYPEAKFTYDQHTLTLMPSRPHILPPSPKS